MFRHSLRVRLLLPVLVLVVTVMVALTVVLAITEADRVKKETGRTIDRQASALQSVFAVTRELMLERVHSSMRLLSREAEHSGRASPGPAAIVGGQPANNLLFGDKPQANDYSIVDDVTAIMGGTATIFSRTGQDFVRISTNVKSDDGSRAVGTVLDPTGPVVAKIANNEGFYGVVDILNTPYVTGYEPIFADGDQRTPIGVWYVGYKTDLAALDKVISEAHLLDSGFVAVLDDLGQLRFHSRTGETVDPTQIASIAKEPPEGWVVVRQDVPDWGFTLVSAYPTHDINRLIVRQSIWIAAIGLGVCIVLLAILYVLISKRVLKPVQNLTTVAEELSLGRWNHTIGEVTLKDEIGTLARAISRLSNSVRLAMERLSKR